MENMSLSDIATVTRGADDFGGSGMWFLAIILILLIAGGGAFGNNGDYGRFASASSQQEILFGQQFQNLDNKMDRLGNGIADSTFALNNAITTAQSNLGSAIVTEGRGIADKLCDLKATVHAEGEATRGLIQQNKIDSLQAQVNELKTQNMFCGVPKVSPYMYNIQPNCGCNCNI